MREPYRYRDWSSASCSGLAFVLSDRLARCISVWWKPFMALLTLSGKQWLLLNWQKQLWLAFPICLSISVYVSVRPTPSHQDTMLLTVWELALDSSSGVCVCVHINRSSYQAELINCMLRPKEWCLERPLLEEKRAIRISLSCSLTHLHTHAHTYMHNLHEGSFHSSVLKFSTKQ